jgi:hypothetical protein
MLNGAVRPGCAAQLQGLGAIGTQRERVIRLLERLRPAAAVRVHPSFRVRLEMLAANGGAAIAADIAG